MNFYKIAKRFVNLRSPRVKLLSLWTAQKIGVRHIGVFVDPVMACNLRCRMCYFSDDESRPKPEAPMTQQAIERLQRVVFPYALKVQIGCGAEPTLYGPLPSLVKAAKDSGVPYVEITSNCQLLNGERLKACIDAGLDGITLSLHGTTASTYENLMAGARFDKLKTFIRELKGVRKLREDFQLRINYTINNLNVEELTGLWTLLDGLRINVLQVRPIQKIGETDYSDFDLGRIYEDYDRLIGNVASRCLSEGTMFIGPTRENLLAVDGKHDSREELIEEVTYCYCSPSGIYNGRLNPETQTFRSYHRQQKTGRRLLKAVLSRHSSQCGVQVTKKMNYKIDS